LPQQGTHGNDLNLLKELAMESTSMMRVNAHPGSYGGHASTPQDRQQQRRQKILALFDAVEHGNLEASKLAFKVLMNFDHALSTDAQFVRLSKALAAGSIYVAQQVVRDLKTKFINAMPLATHGAHLSIQPPRPHQPDGMHFVDTRV
jgi:hypothetical protein